MSEFERAERKGDRVPMFELGFCNEPFESAVDFSFNDRQNSSLINLILRGST